jgi:hypothetical protein
LAWLLLRFIFLTALLGFFAAEFPDDAALAELAVEAGVGTGAASVQAFLTVPHFIFLALHAGLPVRVKTAAIHGVIITKRGILPKSRSWLPGIAA